MADATISLRVSAEEKATWAAAAEEAGLSFTDFVRESLNLRAGFTPYFMDLVKKKTKTIGVSPSHFIQNLTITAVADIDAQSIVHGPGQRHVFVYMPDGLFTDEEYYKDQLDYRTNKEKAASDAERAADLRSEAKHYKNGLLPEEKQKELDELDKNWR